MSTTPGYDSQAGMPMMWQQWSQQPAAQPVAAPLDPEEDNSHRPPNAFILYSQAMRPLVRQENPSLSNTECSRLLGKMWKEVPSEVKMQYKERAAAAQAQFKRDHPNYTYRKARKKRALHELFTKNAQSYPGFLGDPSMMGMMGAQNQYSMMQMFPPGMPQTGMPQPSMGQTQTPTGQPYGMDASMFPFQKYN